MDNEAYVNDPDSWNDPWEDMTDEEFLVGTRLSPTPTESIHQCLFRLAEETNDQGFTNIFANDLVQAAYEVYTEDKDWEEWKDTCTRFLASLRGRPVQSAENAGLADDSSDEKDTEYDMMVDLNEQCVRVFNSEDFVTTTEVDLKDEIPCVSDDEDNWCDYFTVNSYSPDYVDRLDYIAYSNEIPSDNESFNSDLTVSDFTYSSSESQDSDNDNTYYVNHYKVEDVDGHSYTQGQFSDYYGLSWREHWDAALDRSILLYLRILFSEESYDDESDHYYDSCEEYEENEEKELRTNTWTSISFPWQKTCKPREYYETIMGRSYIETNDFDDSSSDYHNDLDSDEEAFWKSIALKEEKDFDDAKTD